jgi:hypothetical protein
MLLAFTGSYTWKTAFKSKFVFRPLAPENRYLFSETYRFFGCRLGDF